MSANERQVGGSHYAKAIQHWDYVAANGLDYFQGQITKYVSRWRDKGGIQDLEKAAHFLQKYIEVEKGRAESKTPVGPPDKGELRRIAVDYAYRLSGRDCDHEFDVFHMVSKGDVEVCVKCGLAKPHAGPPVSAPPFIPGCDPHLVGIDQSLIQRTKE